MLSSLSLKVAQTLDYRNFIKKNNQFYTLFKLEKNFMLITFFDSLITERHWNKFMSNF